MTRIRNASEWGYMSGARGVAEALRRTGVKVLFAEPLASGAVTEAARDLPLEVVEATQAGGAFAMADYLARRLGSPQAVVVAEGAGLAGLWPMMVLSRLDSIPVLVLVELALPEQANTEWYAGELSDFTGRRLPVCKGVFEASEPEEVPTVMAQAVSLSRSGEPGPVVVLFRSKALSAEGRMHGTGFKSPPVAIDTDTAERLERLAARLARKGPVLIYAGAGCHGATDELDALAKKLQAPVMTSLSGLGVLPAVHPLNCGFGPPPACNPLADEIAAGCNTVLAVGCKCYPGLLENFIANQRLFIVDAEPVLPQGLREANCMAVQARSALRILADSCPNRDDDSMARKVLRLQRVWKRSLRTRHPWHDAVDPVKVFLHLRELLEAEDMLVVDAGRHAAYAVACYQVHHPKALVVPVSRPALGYAIPAGVSAAMANSGRRVVACCGERGLLQTAFELLTARRCQVAPVVLLFSEKPTEIRPSLEGRVARLQLDGALAPVNAEQLARALDIGYLCARSDAELQHVLQEALTFEGAVLVELLVRYPDVGRMRSDSGELGPPHLPRPLSLRLAARAVMNSLAAESE